MQSYSDDTALPSPASDSDARVQQHPFDIVTREIFLIFEVGISSVLMVKKRNTPTL